MLDVLSKTSTMPLWDGKFYDRPSLLGTHWIKSLMTCYLAAMRRCFTRSKQMLPPHTGSFQNNVILKDQLKHRQRQTQTKCKHKLILIYCTDMPPACRLHANTVALLLYTCAAHRHTNTAIDTQWDFAGTQNRHCPSFICLCFILWAAIAGRTSHSESCR